MAAAIAMRASAPLMQTASVSPRVQAPSQLRPSLKQQTRRSIRVLRATESESPAETKAEPASAAAVPVSEGEPTGAKLDPEDGTVAEAAPMGDSGNALVSNIFGTIVSLEAAEQINGRAAQMGFLAALYAELTSDQGIREQLFLTREVGEGVFHKTINYPQGGFFMAVGIVLFTVVGSVVPTIKGEEKNGLTKPGTDFGPFKASSEMVNGRMAMMGLAFLYGLEGIMGSKLF